MYQEAEILAHLCRQCGGRCCFNESDITLSQAELQKLQQYDFECGVLHSPYGDMATIKIHKNGMCPFLGKPHGIYSERGCILKGQERPLSCRLFPLTFVAEGTTLTFYLSGFCPHVEAVSTLKTWIKKSIEDARRELQTWTAAEKLCRSYWHKKHNNLIHIREE